MRILLVAATSGEVLRSHNCEVLITGVGMVNTAISLTQKLCAEKFDLAINVGVAGALDRQMVLGSVFQVSTDCFADLGAEDGDRFLSAPEIGLVKSTEWQLEPTYPLPDLPAASAITVNTVHGNDSSIETLRSRLSADLESMEGAAFFAVCHHFGVPCAQIRAVSNYVERRNRGNWKMAEAIQALDATLYKVLAMI